MCSPGINGEGELRGQMANSGKVHLEKRFTWKKSWVMECDGITFHRLAYPKLTWASCIIVLTAIGYLLLGETVAKHLVSPPIPVPQQYHVNSIVG